MSIRFPTPFQLIALSMALAAGSATAQSPKETTAPAPASAPAKKKKVIRLEAVTIEGRIHKPQAFYILQRSNLSMDELNRAESFKEKLVKSVQKDPF